MKAIVVSKYGPADVLQLTEGDKPVPGEDQVLVKVHAASINTADLTYGGALLVRLLGGISKPKDTRIGKDLAGVVEAVGSKVTQFKPGDEVFGACMGSFAEYAITHEHNLVLKPSNSTFEEAAAFPVAAITALQGLRDFGKIQTGQKVVIYGASGAVGTFAVQIARAFGAEVTAVCHTHNLDMVRSIGATHVIDYTHDDFTRNGQKYDLILGINGYHPIGDYRRSLTNQGRFVLVGADHTHAVGAIFQAMLLGPLMSRKEGQTLGFMGIAKIKQSDLEALKELLEARKVIPVIDRRYTLSEAAEAARYLESGHVRAKVIITIIGNS